MTLKKVKKKFNYCLLHTNRSNHCSINYIYISNKNLSNHDSQWGGEQHTVEDANGVLCVQQAIRVLGLLGALDPYKHKVNIGMIDQSRDASAVSLSESKSSQDSGKATTDLLFGNRLCCRFRNAE